MTETDGSSEIATGTNVFNAAPVRGMWRRLTSPDDVLAGLREAAGFDAGPAPIQVRLAQGPFDSRTGSVGDPLSPDRDAVRPSVTETDADDRGQ